MKLAALLAIIVAFGKRARRKQNRQQRLKKPRIEMGKITCELINQFAERFFVRMVALPTKRTVLPHTCGGTIFALMSWFVFHISTVQQFTNESFP